ncbi:hypothetical protein GCM10022242_25830 [Nocardioides panacisoli]|uniref:DUF4352 domain-containing protein n=2 Tax=Nocardioides panacisoli TaxID=627624 RepID=A0ABP7IPB2_9ACTN
MRGAADPAHYAADMARDTALEPPTLPHPTTRPRTLRWLVLVAVVLVLGAWLAWFLRSPGALPTEDRSVTASGVVGTPLYVRAFSAPSDFGRTLHVSGVKVHTEASADVTVTPLLCTGGSINDVTTAPEQFCDDLANPEGKDLAAGDSILLEIQADQPVEAHIDRLSIGFRQDIRSATEPAGVAGVDVTLAASGKS